MSSQVSFIFIKPVDKWNDLKALYTHRPNRWTGRHHKHQHRKLVFILWFLTNSGTELHGACLQRHSTQLTKEKAVFSWRATWSCKVIRVPTCPGKPFPVLENTWKMRKMSLREKLEMSWRMRCFHTPPRISFPNLQLVYCFPSHTYSSDMQGLHVCFALIMYLQSMNGTGDVNTCVRL